MTLNDTYPTLPSDSSVATLNFDLDTFRAVATQYKYRIPLADDSVHEITCFSVLQFMTGPQRISIWNEWYRVLEPAGRVHVTVPHYSHIRSFAHPWSQWPPMSDLSFFFLSKLWREQGPSTFVEGLECDFDIETITTPVDNDPRHGYAVRTPAWIDEATKWFWNVAAELDVWLVKR